MATVTAQQTSIPRTEAPHRNRSRVWEISVILLILIGGLVVRCWRLDNPVLFVDEAESAINALTILQHGVPTDHYLGMPIYENTMTQFWPENPEYEFKDTSYSKKGVAIYHGWFPLYSIAAALKLGGIEPDQPTAVPTIQHPTSDIAYRTVIPRIPSMVFAAIFMLATYFAGRAMYGRDAGFLAMTIVAFIDNTVRISREARYYSATLAFSMLACWVIWNILRRQRVRDYVYAAIIYGLLFHTHMLTCMVACAVLGFSLLWNFKSINWKGAILFGVLMILATVPWLIATGFLDAVSGPHMARALYRFPKDYIHYLQRHWRFFSVLAVAVLILIAARHRRLKSIESLQSSLGPIAILALWGFIGFVLFFITIPAASSFYWRAALSVMGPVILLGSILAIMILRNVHPRWTIAVTTIVFIGLASVAVRTMLKPPQPAADRSAAADLLRELEKTSFAAGTKIYSIPFQHLPMTYYSGLPVQSIGPVRAKFLNEYPGPIVMLETVNRYPQVPFGIVNSSASRVGDPMSPADLRKWTGALSNWQKRKALQDKGATVDPPLETDLPPWSDRVFQWQDKKMAEIQSGQYGAALDNPVMFGPYRVPDIAAFWVIYTYRFVNPLERSGDKLNYAERVRTAHAQVLPSGWTIFRCPPLTAQKQN